MSLITWIFVCVCVFVFSWLSFVPVLQLQFMAKVMEQNESSDMCAEPCEKVPQTFSMFQKVVIVHLCSPLKFQACTGTVLGVGLVNLCFF